MMWGAMIALVRTKLETMYTTKQAWSRPLCCFRRTGKLGSRDYEKRHACCAYHVTLHFSSTHRLLFETAATQHTTALGDSFFHQLRGAQLMLYVPSRVTHRLKCVSLLCGRLSGARSSGLSHAHMDGYTRYPIPLERKNSHGATPATLQAFPSATETNGAPTVCACVRA